MFGYDVKSERDPVTEEQKQYVQMLFSDIEKGTEWDLRLGDSFYAEMSATNMMSFQADDPPVQPERASDEIKSVFPVRASFQFDRFAFSFTGAYIDSDGRVYAVGAFEMEDGVRLSCYRGQVYRDRAAGISVSAESSSDVVRKCWDSRVQRRFFRNCKLSYIPEPFTVSEGARGLTATPVLVNRASGPRNGDDPGIAAGIRVGSGWRCGGNDPAEGRDTRKDIRETVVPSGGQQCHRGTDGFNGMQRVDRGHRERDAACGIDGGGVYLISIQMILGRWSIYMESDRLPSTGSSVVVRMFLDHLKGLMGGRQIGTGETDGARNFSNRSFRDFKRTPG